MSDIAISYASTDRRAVLTLADYLEQQGLSVWMDDWAGEGADEAGQLSSVGVVAGARHRDVIEQALLDASLVLIIDSPDWRVSDYCRWEFEVAQDAGKRVCVMSAVTLKADLSATHDDAKVSVGSVDRAVDAQVGAEADAPAVWPAGSIAELLERFRVGLARAEAHSRLIGAARTARQDQRASRIPDANLIADARTVTTGGDSTDQLTLDSQTQVFVDDLLRRAAIWRRQRRWASIATVAVVLALAVGALAFWRLAVSHYEAAAADAAVQDSMRLAGASRQATDTSTQARLAAEAEAKAETVQARTASVAATNQLRQHQIIAAPPAVYRSARLTADGNSLLIATSSELIRYDLALGTEQERVAVGARLRSGPMAPDSTGRVVGVVDAASNRLQQVDMVDKSVTSLTEHPVAAIAVGGDDTLWWLTDERTLVRQPYPWTDAATQSSYELPTAGTALAAGYADARSISVLFTDGRLATFRPSGSSLGEAQTLTLFDQAVQPHPITDESSGQIDLVLSCPAGMVAMRSGTFAGVDGDGRPWTSGSTKTPSRALKSGATSIGCLAEGGVAMSGWSSFTMTGPDRTPDPVRILWRGLGSTGSGSADENRAYVASGSRAGGAILTGDGTRVVVVNQAGGIDVITLALAPSQSAAHLAFAAVPFTSGLLLVAPDGNVYDGRAAPERNQDPLTDLDGSIRPQEPVMTPDGAAWLRTTDAVARLQAGSSEGATPAVDRCAIPEAEREEIRGLRAGSEGSADSAMLFTGEKYTVIEANALAEGGTRCVVEMTAVPGLEQGESVFDAVGLTGGRLAVSTSNSRVLLIDQDRGSLAAEVNLGVAYSATYLAALPQGGVLAASGDGVIVRYDSDLRPQAASLMPGGIVMMTMTPDGRRALVRAVNGSITIVDPTSLDEIQSLPSIPNAQHSTFVADQSSGSVWGLGLSWTEGGGRSDAAAQSESMSASLVKYPMLSGSQ